MSDTAVADNEKDISENESTEGQEDAGHEGQDDGSEGSDAEGLGEDGLAEEEVGDGAGRQPSRSQRRIERLAEETRTERARADRLERDLADERQRRQRESESDEQLRLAAMTEGERFDFLRNKDRRENDAKLGQIQFGINDSNDRSAFREICNKTPALAKLAPEVEKLLAEARRAGQNPSREILGDILLGRKAREKAPAQVSKQRVAAQQERQRQTGKPGGGRGDVSGGRPGKSESAEERRARIEGYRF